MSDKAMLRRLNDLWVLCWLLSSAKFYCQAGANEWRVIGAGLGRTGTDSMKHALGILGLGEMYHMKALLRGHPCTVDHMRTVWAPLASGEYNASDIRERLACFSGGLDYPVSPYFRELMDIYPDAKVLLTTRSPKSWAISARNTICPAALMRGADFNMTIKFQIPWHVRIIRFALPQAPGTDDALYKDMMSAVVSKIEKPYIRYLEEKKKVERYCTSGGDDDLAENSCSDAAAAGGGGGGGGAAAAAAAAAAGAGAGGGDGAGGGGGGGGGGGAGGAGRSVDDVLKKEMFLEELSPSSSRRSPQAYCRGSNQEMMMLFEAWEKYVKSVVPPDRLVVFQIGKDKWPELCASLNLTVPLRNSKLPHHPEHNPPVPFPHINTSGDYFTMLSGRRLLATLILVSVTLNCVLAVVSVWYCCCRSRRLNRIALFEEHQRRQMFMEEPEDDDDCSNHKDE